MRLSTSCLPISKNCCIVPDEAAEDQVSGTHVKDFLLGRIGRKHAVELELLLPNQQLVVSIIHVYAGPLASLPRLLELNPNEGSHSYCDSYGAGILYIGLEYSRGLPGSTAHERNLLDSSQGCHPS